MRRSEDLERFIEKITTKKALVFTGLFAAAFVLINYSELSVAGLLKITNGANILDFEFGFSSAEANSIVTALGEQGRSFYLTKIIPIDFVFPVTYMLCYAGWIARLAKNTMPMKGAKRLLILPLLAMLFDWLENAGVIMILTQYPGIPEGAVALASTAGMIKFTFTLCSMVTIMVLLVMSLLKRRIKNKTAQQQRELC